MSNKNILIIIFIFVGLYVVLNFRDHNSKRALDACIAGSKMLEKEMNNKESHKLCADQIIFM